MFWILKLELKLHPELKNWNQNLVLYWGKKKPELIPWKFYKLHNSLLEPRNHSTLVITTLEIYTSHDLPTLKNTNLLENNAWPCSDRYMPLTYLTQILFYSCSWKHNRPETSTVDNPKSSQAHCQRANRCFTCTSLGLNLLWSPGPKGAIPASQHPRVTYLLWKMFNP